MSAMTSPRDGGFPSAAELIVWCRLATDPILEGARQRGYLDVEAAADELVAHRGSEVDKADIVSAIYGYDPEVTIDLEAAREAFASAEVTVRQDLLHIVIEGAARSEDRILSALPPLGDEATVARSFGNGAVEAILDAAVEPQLAVAADHDEVSIETQIAQLQVTFPEGPAPEALVLVLGLCLGEASPRIVSYARPTLSAFVSSADLSEAKTVLRDLGASLVEA